MKLRHFSIRSIRVSLTTTSEEEPRRQTFTRDSRCLFVGSSSLSLGIHGRWTHLRGGERRKHYMCCSFSFALDAVQLSWSVALLLFYHPPNHTRSCELCQDTMQKLRAQPPCVQRPRSVHVSDDLSSCTHVFIRHDATRKSLQCPYNGPYRILSRADKHFTVDIGRRKDVVTLDRLKPAHLKASQSQPDPPDQSQPDPPATKHSLPMQPTPTQVTVPRSGRHIHWPTRFVFVSSLEGE